jgi:hypothetical protein
MIHIDYDRKGAKLIMITFLVSLLINHVAYPQPLYLSITGTIGVFLIIILVLFVKFIISLFKYKKIIFYTDKKVVYYMLLCEFFYLWDVYQQLNPN